MMQIKQGDAGGWGWVELAQKASRRAGWYGQLGEIPGMRPRMGRRSHSKAQGLELAWGQGSGLEVVRETSGLQEGKAGRMNPLGGALT